MTTANLKVAYKNGVDHPACVLTSSNPALSASLALDNLKNYKRRSFRAAASPALSIYGDYGGDGFYATVVAMLRHNIEPAGTYRFRGWSDMARTDPPVVDTTALPGIEASTLGTLGWGSSPLGSSVYDSFYGQQNSIAGFTRALIVAWTLDIDDTGNSAGYIDLSRLWIGDDYELSINPIIGSSSLGWKEESQLWETDGGGVHVDASQPYRSMKLGLAGLSETDRIRLMDVLRYCGSRRDILFRLFPDGTDDQIRDASMNGIIVPPLPDLSFDEGDLHSASIVIREA